MLQALVLWSTMGLLLTTVGFTVDTWQFWTFIGMFWAVERLGRLHGAAEGIIKYLTMSDAEQARIRKIFMDTRTKNND